MSAGRIPPKGGGVGDHGDLTGLDDADHNASYYTETELDDGVLDARYYTEDELDSLLGAKAPLASPNFTGTPLAPDHGAAATDMLVNVCYGTGAPPDPATVTEGAIFIKYVA